MRNRWWCTGPLIIVGAAALAAVFALAASGSPNSRDGVTKTLSLAVAGTDVDYTDPALAYAVPSWQIEYETCSTLVGYSDVGGASSELSPDAATGFPVISNHGKTYTFTIRRGIRFDDGAPVTPESFAAAFNRDANPAMESPVDAFMGDVVGYDNVVDKKASTVSGVVAKGDTLTIKLTTADGGLLDKLAMPFFCAIEPSKTPVDPNGVDTLPGSGPYYIADRTIGKEIVLKTNPYYTGNRPHRSDTIVMTMNTDPQQTFLQVSNGTYAADPEHLDEPAAAGALEKKYGLNKSRFFVHASPETDYLALNTQSPIFGSAAMRKAVNYAIDRPALLRVRGVLGGTRTTTILPRSLTGGVYDQRLYPIAGAEPAKAKSLARGACGNVNLWYSANPAETPQAGIVQYDLAQMGCKVTAKPFVGYALFSAAGVKGADFDLMFAGWYQDYADGYDFFHILLDGRTIQNANNDDLAYFNQPTVNAKIDAANKLTGTARAKAWGSLDIYTMKNYAPWAPIDNENIRDFIGPHTAGYQFSPAWGSMDLGTLYLK
ncbi:MAG TPA: ABC transporter substrate-binding protein [Gaiellaceae bacterium]|nr:ABC transporter substrate-binding protein [Gaiellaceae bacterium]